MEETFSVCRASASAAAVHPRLRYPYLGKFSSATCTRAMKRTSDTDLIDLSGQDNDRLVWCWYGGSGIVPLEICCTATLSR